MRICSRLNSGKVMPPTVYETSMEDVKRNIALIVDFAIWSLSKRWLQEDSYQKRKVESLVEALNKIDVSEQRCQQYQLVIPSCHIAWNYFIRNWHYFAFELMPKIMIVKKHLDKLTDQERTAFTEAMVALEDQD